MESLGLAFWVCLSNDTANPPAMFISDQHQPLGVFARVPFVRFEESFVSRKTENGEPPSKYGEVALLQPLPQIVLLFQHLKERDSQRTCVRFRSFLSDR